MTRKPKLPRNRGLVFSKKEDLDFYRIRHVSTIRVINNRWKCAIIIKKHNNLFPFWRIGNFVEHLQGRRMTILFQSNNITKSNHIHLTKPNQTQLLTIHVVWSWVNFRWDVGEEARIDSTHALTLVPALISMFSRSFFFEIVMYFAGIKGGFLTSDVNNDGGTTTDMSIADDFAFATANFCFVIVFDWRNNNGIEI